MMYLADESLSPEWKGWEGLNRSLSYFCEGQTGRVDVSGVRSVAVDVPGEVGGGDGDRWDALSSDCVSYRVSGPGLSFQLQQVQLHGVLNRSAA